ncbi:MAG: hypothetical protein QMD86_01105 [Patescibacteria group bacterium]|nr:hypothetical protein [Patescibacteria group bacterium]
MRTGKKKVIWPGEIFSIKDEEMRENTKKRRDCVRNVGWGIVAVVIIYCLILLM